MCGVCECGCGCGDVKRKKAGKTVKKLKGRSKAGKTIKGKKKKQDA